MVFVDGKKEQESGHFGDIHHPKQILGSDSNKPTWDTALVGQSTHEDGASVAGTQPVLFWGLEHLYHTGNLLLLLPPAWPHCDLNMSH
jgi:hypothetical protein